MRSADFNSTNSKIRVLQEVRPKKKKINWDRLIYFFFIIASILTVLYYVARNNLYVRAEGQVLFRKLEIQFTQDVQIINIVKEQGDRVYVGDTLFYYYDEKAINHSTLVRHELPVSSDNLDWIIRERLTTQKKIEIAKISIDEANQLINMTQLEKDRLQKEIYLDIYPASKLDPYIHRLVEFRGQIDAMNEEIKFHEKYLGWLAVQERLEVRREQLRERLADGYIPLVLRAYISPVEGVITHIAKENHEVALESEIVMAVHKPANLYIQAFYDQQDVEHLKEGDIVDVTFPDGSESQGKVHRFYVATYELPLEFQKRYEPLTRSIAAEIIPLDPVHAGQWQAFYKLNAEISKPIFAFLD